jgi:hypothetical protein
VADRKVLRVTLRYANIDSLFDRPEISPFSEDFHEYSTVSGIEHIYGELQANPSLKRVETTIVLPPEQITPNLEQRTREAIRRYCLARSREVGQSERSDGGRCARSPSRSYSSSPMYSCRGDYRPARCRFSKLSSKDWISLSGSPFGFPSMPSSSACYHTTLTPTVTSALHRCS